MQAQSYLVIGTNTNVGKTYVASRLIQHFVLAGFNTIGMKPIASGCEVNANGNFINEDVTALMAVSNVKAPLDYVNPYRFTPAIAPHIAASQAGVQIQLAQLLHAYQQLSQLADVVIVEGAGGFCVPINETQTLADLAAQLKLPIVLVVGMQLGCINHALLTVEAIQARGLTLAGWVANQIDPSMEMFEENVESLSARINALLLSTVLWRGEAEFNIG
jgi:dethiobiotin synthetase